MPKLNRDGVNIYYDVRGAGTPLLLTHGYSATSHMWAGQIEAFSSSYKLITWDMRGHGQSDYPDSLDQYTEAATVADMAAILDAVGEERAIIGGLSLGGYMSLAFHLAHAKRTMALLIIDTGPGYRREDTREAWNVTAIGRAEQFERDGLTALAGAETRTAPHRNAEGLARAARGVLTQKDARVIDSLPGINVPSIVIVGENDTPYLAAADYMAAKIPGAQKVVIKEAGHASNIDQPQAFNSAVLGFLASLKLRTV
jgi:pimeloyl-ACP methyl ester carboxylesterase